MSDGTGYLEEIRKKLESGQRQWKRGDKILAAFGYVRRRQTFVDQFNAALEKHGLYAQPPVTTEMSLDGYTNFFLKSAKGARPPKAAAEPPPAEVAEEAKAELAVPPPVDTANPADLSLTIRNLECAERMPLWVKPSTTIAEAITQMQLKDYSQLVIATGERSVKGIVSYHSIASAQLLSQPTRVDECVDASVPTVALSTPLLDVIAHFQRHDCVLVIADDKRLCGIVTPADIAVEFGNMAGPFLVIGEIEEHLRWLLERGAVDLTAIPIAQPPAKGKPPAKVSDLTMGEIERIFQNPDHWAKVGLKFDRATFCGELGDIRNFRNALMHFREPIAGDDLNRIRNFADMLRTACAAIARKPPAAT